MTASATSAQSIQWGPCAWCVAARGMHCTACPAVGMVNLNRLTPPIRVTSPPVILAADRALKYTRALPAPTRCPVVTERPTTPGHVQRCPNTPGRATGLDG